MPLVIPTFPEYHQHEMSIVIAETLYIVTFTWRERQAGWYMDMKLQDETFIVRGRRLTPGWAPLLGLLLPDAPPGIFFVQSPDEYVQTDFGGKFRLYYVSDDEAIADDSSDSEGLTFEVV